MTIQKRLDPFFEIFHIFDIASVNRLRLGKRELFPFSEAFTIFVFKI